MSIWATIYRVILKALSPNASPLQNFSVWGQLPRQLTNSFLPGRACKEATIDNETRAGGFVSIAAVSTTKLTLS